MKIAVTYDENQNVFQHFGHTEQFKIYEIENNSVVSSRFFLLMEKATARLPSFWKMKILTNSSAAESADVLLMLLGKPALKSLRVFQAALTKL